MRSLHSIMQTSLDGFVAGADSGFDNFVGGEENLEFICGITDTADLAMLGRVSFQLLDADWPTAGTRPGATKNIIKYSNWYNSALKVVFSRTLSGNHTKNTVIMNEIHIGEIAKLKQQPGKDMLIFGSPTLVHELLERNVLDTMWLIVHPVLFGDGIPLFRKRNQVDKLLLVCSHLLSNGTLCNQYAWQK